MEGSSPKKGQISVDWREIPYVHPSTPLADPQPLRGGPQTPLAGLKTPSDGPKTPLTNNASEYAKTGCHAFNIERDEHDRVSIAMRQGNNKGVPKGYDK